MKTKSTQHLTLLVVILLASWVAPPLLAQHDTELSGLDAVRDALKANDYVRATKLANDALAAVDEHPDEVLYLKALALYHDGEHEQSRETLDRLISEHPESIWFRKARFLKADSFVKQRQFEQAEAIYEHEAKRLLSVDRKQEVAGVFIRFADDLSTVPDPNDLSAPPANHNKAYSLYKRALEMEIDRELRDDVLYKLALSAQRAGNHQQASAHFQEYLTAFDPTWTGPVGSLERMRAMKRETPVERGSHVFDARYRLGKSQLAMSQWKAARQNFEDLLGLIETGEVDDAGTRRADTSWQIVRSYHMPGVVASELEQALATATDFVATHRDHRHSVEAAWLIAWTSHQHGQADAAVAAYEAFLNGESYDLPPGDRATETIERLAKSATELEAQWRPIALYQIGVIRYSQRQYDPAIEAWRRYVSQFPNGANWADAQRQIIDSQFMIAIDAVAAEHYTDARQMLGGFLATNPLDSRAAQVLFILGEIEHAQENWKSAIAEWGRLVTKYPNTEESSLALYRTGVIYEETLGELDNALETYRRLTWGSYGPMAQARVAIMTQKQLQLQTERTFRTNESPQVSIATRNIETLTVRQYFLDPEAYFRKTHTIGGVESLDIALIEPDKTWDIEIDNYTRYQPLEQTIEVPFDGDQPGVCIINVSEDDWEATTLVVRSDIELIMRTSRREAIGFVQNMRTNQPANGVSLVFSDGAAVFDSGLTEEDGVFHRAFDQLKTISDLRVFAIQDGHVASNALSLSGLNLSQGLSRKGYIYTDRPAYQPGQLVNARGIIRDVIDGSYVVSKDEDYIITVTDPQGRMLREEATVLSPYGTFSTSFGLDSAAPVGTYSITARRSGRTAAMYSGQFEVQQFQLQKMELTFDFDQEVYFRGEVVEADLRAKYYWGEPVANQSIRYQLPDGRSFVEKTDDQGSLKISYDTAGISGGGVLTFLATIEGESVSTAGMVYMPRFGFNMNVSSSQDLALAGEPFDITINTTAPDGTPVGQELSVLVLRREAATMDPVLQNVPWINLPRTDSSDVTVEEHVVSTDADSGKGTLRLKLAAGGLYTFRVAGADRFDQPVVASTQVRVSDDEDATRLRLFARSNTLQVGDDASFRLHSRVDEGLALITFEGESILSHRVTAINKGNNTLTLGVDHQHFPNFAVSVSMMDGRELRVVTKPFEVERELKITLTPLADTYAPGETGVVELTVTDQLGNPVEAELSLALVNEALLAQYPDQTPEIRSFFQQGTRRFVEFRVAATNGFSYEAQTRATVKAFADEENRIALRESEGEQLRAIRDQLASLSRVDRSPGRGGGGRGASLLGDIPMLPAMMDEEQGGSKSVERRFGYSWQASSDDLDVAGQMNNGQAADKSLHFYADFKSRGLLAAGESVWGEPRRERAEAGWWNGSIITDAQGKATIELPMPQSTTRWQLMARGVSKNTLAGQGTAVVTTRQDFFVELKTPRAALEGDQLRIFARVHNATDLKHPVRLEMIVSSGGNTHATATTTVEHVDGQPIEFLFDVFDVPAVGAIDITVRAAGMRAGQTDPGMLDSVTKSIIVHPYGLPYAAHGGGVTTGSPRLLLELPKDLRYSSQWLTISVGPDLQQQIIDMALSSRPIVRGVQGDGRITPPMIVPDYGTTPGSELLAAVAGLTHAKDTNAAKADRTRLTTRARSLVSALIVSQNDDGGWSWGRRTHGDFMVTATSYWALVEARSAGLTVNADTLAKARTLLDALYQRAEASDYDQKATVLHALSAADHGDFKLANSLYRERNALTPLALAYTSLALVNLDRNDMAVEVLSVLESKVSTTSSGGRRFASWKAQSRYHSWLNDPVESTAIALLALMRATPSAAVVEATAQFLLQEYGCFGFGNGRTRGVGILGLAEYFRKGQFANTNFELAISVNGRTVRSVTARGSNTAVVFDVPADILNAGLNEIAFDINGRGRYAYAATLRGFSPEFKDPQTLTRGPYVHSRRYFHSPLRYRGVEIGASSSSPVQNLAIGQRTRVYVDVYDTGYDGFLIVEESLPAGATLVPGSLQGGGVTHHEVRDGKIIMYVPRGEALRDYRYELVGYSTGNYNALPTVIRDAFDPSKMRVHKPAEINVLAPGDPSDDPYQMNDAERYALGKAHFDDGLNANALNYLWPLFDRERKYQERDVARMLLWIHTTDAHFNPDRVVDAFELLSVRHPDLRIPFDRILRVGEAYRYIGEFERAWLVFRATIESSFRNDSMISAILEDEGQILASFDYQEALGWEYPDLADVVASYFALAQTIYDESVNAPSLARVTRDIVLPGVEPRDDDHPNTAPVEITRVTMLADAIAMLDSFLSLYPESPLRDDAAFSKTSAFLDLKEYDAVVRLSEQYSKKFADSDFQTSFQYMKALGWFWQRAYDDALAAARIVADGTSHDRDFARYILGQIYHAEGRPGDAIEWYAMVRTQYPDADEAINYFEEKKIALDEVNIFKPGEAVDISIDYRNIKEASLQVYKVDLMKLYLREKNLSSITAVNLAGIAPQLIKSIELGDGKDYMDKEFTTQLALEDEGAYLVICRGDNLFTSGLVLITPLELEVQEDTSSARVRVNLTNAVDQIRPAEVHVKVVGSADGRFASGETDLRGIFVADSIVGTVTVIAQDKESRYAFYRGDTWLGAPANARGRQQGEAQSEALNAVDYTDNLRQQQVDLQRSNRANFDAYRRGGKNGVEVQEAR